MATCSLMRLELASFPFLSPLSPASIWTFLGHLSKGGSIPNHCLSFYFCRSLAPTEDRENPGAQAPPKMGSHLLSSMDVASRDVRNLYEIFQFSKYSNEFKLGFCGLFLFVCFYVWPKPNSLLVVFNPRATFSHLGQVIIHC